MKRTHGLDEREMELVKLLMADCQTTGDIQAKLKRINQLISSLSVIIKKLRLAGSPRISHLISPKFTRFVMQRFCLNAVIAAVLDF